MIICKICGYKTKFRLIRHVNDKHNLSVKEYKEKYGEVVTNEYKEKVGARSRKMWSNLSSRKKLVEARNRQFTPEVREKISQKVKFNYKNGFKNWNIGKTKEQDDRLASIGRKNRKHLTGRKKERYAYLQKHSDRMKHRWKDGKISPRITKINSEWMTPEEYEAWRKKISETISKKYRTGEIRFSNKYFKSGRYKNWNYDSGKELEVMKLLDASDKILTWSKDFDSIPYNDENGDLRRYVPDFFIQLKNGKTIVIEYKGYDTRPQRVQFKADAAKKKYPFYFVCQSIKEVIKTINENS